MSDIGNHHLNSQRQVILDIFESHRDNPIVSQVMQVPELEGSSIVLANSAQETQALGLLEKHLGPQHARAAREILGTKDASCFVALDGQETLLSAAIVTVTAGGVVDDPVLNQCNVLGRHMIGQPVPTFCFRYLVSRKGTGPGGSDMTAILLSAPLILALHVGRAPLSFFCVPDGSAWRPLTTLFPVNECLDSEVPHGGQTFSLFASEPPPEGMSELPKSEIHTALISQIVHRMLEGMSYPVRAPSGITRDMWVQGLHAALKKLSHPMPAAPAEVLNDPRFGDSGSAERGWLRLQRMIVEGVEALQASPQTSDAAYLLRESYLGEKRKQEAVAAQLGVPFGTYRYRLRRAEQLLADHIWHLCNGAPS